MEPAELGTSIGTVYVQAYGHDRLNIRNYRVFPHVGSIHLSLKRRGDCWEFAEKPLPPALSQELLTLGRNWADANPEEFAEAERAHFDLQIHQIVHEHFGKLTQILTDMQDHFRHILDDREFRKLASPALRRRLQKEAQRAHVAVAG